MDKKQFLAVVAASVVAGLVLDYVRKPRTA